ncbi:MAG: U32 family peptidase C-terminal domain-containing protein [Alphaproteobacteria bacterium]
MKYSELLMPAGSLTKLKTAIMYGADAVYCGMPDMNLRAATKMTVEELKEGIEFAHNQGKKVYLTLNLFTKNKDIARLPELVKSLNELNPDGVIISDPAVFMYVKEHAPQIKRHVSTQANVCSYETVKFWQDLGADMCVLGRETSFAELVEIKEKCPNIRLEAFIHGAMCMSYSGRCLISNFLADRSSNQGKCAHCCRWHYKVFVKKNGTTQEIEVTNEDQIFLKEDFREDELFEVIEDENGSYIMNSKDLCLMPKLPHILDAGIDCLKIEGRNKTEYYAGIVARTYRMAIDEYKNNPENWSADKYMAELDTLQNRGYTLGFYNGSVTNYDQNYNFTRTLGDYQFAGSIVEWQNDDAIFELRNFIEAGETIEFLAPNGENISHTFIEFEDASDGSITQKVSAGQGKQIRIKGLDKNILPTLTIARKKVVLKEDVQKLIDNAREIFKINQ